MTTESKASREAERSGDAAAAAASSSSPSSSTSAAAAAAVSAPEQDLAPISPPRAVGGRELRSTQFLPEVFTEGGAAAAAARGVVAHAVDCEMEEDEGESDGDEAGVAGVADGPSSAAAAPPPPPLLPATSSPLTEGRPSCYLVVHNVSKKHNVGSLARAATAFGVSEVVLVGKNQYHAFGAHGSAAHVFFRHFPKLSQAKEWLCRERGARLLGVEIDDGAVSVTAPGVFQGNTAFLMGNEGTGLSPSQIAACDGLVYIPHHGRGTASLNVACAACVVLHRFSEFARYGEAPRSGAKFEVAARPARNAPRGRANLDAEAIAALKEERAARKAEKGGAEVEGMMEALSM